jgi:glyoxylase I family protein
MYTRCTFATRRISVTETIKTGPVHHVRLTVTDVDRARDFYSRIFGFELVLETPTGVLLKNGSFLLGLGLPEGGGPVDDRFDESRVGLDHLSLSVPDRGALEQAVRVFDQEAVENDGINDLKDFGLYVLPFRDPDNIFVELTAAYP